MAADGARTPHASFDTPLADGCVHALRVATPGVAVLVGSLRIAPAGDDGDAPLQALVAALSTCATARHDADALADALDARGASLSLEADAGRMTFRAQASDTDLPQVIALLAECLREPAFDAETFDSERARLAAELAYAACEPATMAADALARALYPPGHPRHPSTPDEALARLDALSVADARRFHRERFGGRDLRVAIVGDIDPERAGRMVERTLGDWPAPAWHATRLDAQAPIAASATSLADIARDASALRIDAPGSGRFEAALGHRLAIRCDHPDYMALRLANHILGGGFGSRLVRAVRIERGLTYAIRSQLAKPALDFDGHWQVEVSLSPEHLDAGLAAIRETIARFVDTGVSDDELAVRKREIVGAFQISLATLHGLAETLLFGAERGLGAGYPQRFAEQAAAVTAAQLARAIAEHLRPDDLRIAIAGPFDDI